MAKLYWATAKDDAEWFGPHSSKREVLKFAREFFRHQPPSHVWIAPVDAEKDDDEKFWAEVAELMIVHANRDLIDEELAADGWIDPEEPFYEWDRKDCDGILARALREVLGPRPAWRTVDTAKAERIEL